MDDRRFTEHDAVLYVCGELDASERRRFESEIDRSPQLRSEVRNLEMASMILALGLPRCDPPTAVWNRIEEQITRDQEQHVPHTPAWRKWLMNGWAAACLCVVGWFFYAVSVRPNAVPEPETSQANASLEGHAHREFAPAMRAAAFRQTNATSANEPVESSDLSLQARGQIAGLRRQVFELEQQVSQLSKRVAEQQAFLAQPGHATFFTLLAPNSATGQGVVAPPSPEMQRALLLAIARQFGWVPRIATDDEDSNPATGVDFVDVIEKGHIEVFPGGQGAEITLQSEHIALHDADAKPGVAPAHGSPEIIGSLIDTNTILVLNTAALSFHGSEAAVIGGSLQSGFQTFANVPLGENPVVVTIPNAFLSPGTSFEVKVGDYFYSIPGPFPFTTWSGTNTLH